MGPWVGSMKCSCPGAQPGLGSTNIPTEEGNQGVELFGSTQRRGTKVGKGLEGSHEGTGGVQLGQSSCSSSLCSGTGAEAEPGAGPGRRSGKENPP